MLPPKEFHLTMNTQLEITKVVHKCNYEYATRDYNSCSQMQRVIYKQCGCKVEKNEGNEIAAVCSLG